MKPLAHLLLLLLTWNFLPGQTLLSLSETWQRAKQTNPILKTQSLINKRSELLLRENRESWLPKIQASAQLSTQSEVLQLPIPNLEPLPREQYRITTDVLQPLYQGGTNSIEKQMVTMRTLLEQESLNSKQLALYRELTNLYFGILSLQVQIQHHTTLQKDLQEALQQAQVRYAGGVILKRELLTLQASFLSSQQQSALLDLEKQALAKKLSQHLGDTKSEAYVLEIPPPPQVDTLALRPELSVLEQQQEIHALEAKLLDSRKRPRVDAFLQVGYGRPGLNMLSRSPDFFSLAGLRMSIPISAFYTLSNDKELKFLAQEEIKRQKEDFLLQQQLQATDLQAGQDKLRLQEQTAKKLVEIQESITSSYRVQFHNGDTTALDYSRELSALERLRSEQDRLGLELLKNQYLHALLFHPTLH